MQRHLITCEFPPELGGVGDYTNLVATELAAGGDEVHVWCPYTDSASDQPSFDVHQDLGRIGLADLTKTDLSLNKFRAPRQIIVQWVPHGYGYKSLNLPFCIWLWKRAKLNGDSVELMVHEPFVSLTEGGVKQFAAACIHRIMVSFLLSAASKVWLSTSAWEASLRPYALGRKIPLRSLPIFSNIPVHPDPDRVAQVRSRYCGDRGVLLGHFGTHGPQISLMLRLLIPSLLESSQGNSLLLIGPKGQELMATLLTQHPNLTERVSAAGALTPADLSCHIQACDVMIQPYPDGITTRRGSSMACFAHSRPVVSTYGRLTEPFWHNEPAIILQSATDPSAIANSAVKLIQSAPERSRMGRDALSLYNRRFHISHTIAAIRSQDRSQAA